MEKYEVVKIFEDLSTRLNKIQKVLNLESLKNKISELDRKMLENDFWTDQRLAKKTISENNQLKDKLTRYNNLLELINEISMLIELDDEEMFNECDAEVKKIIKKLQDFETFLLLNEEFDNNNAIMEIHPGAGGTESQDWGLMLFRMYKRYAERNNFEFEVIDYQDGEEAGIKSVVFKINGPYAYGLLKGETGAHRLVRLSPFNSANLRMTSFVGVSVIPEINDEIEIEINEDDVRIDTYRSTGHGGQHINKTDSAVRLTHIPTGIVVTSQSQRSQIQNREKAWGVLKARLYQRELEIKNQKKKEINGDLGNNGFGSQIRNYVLHPYSLVKDNRTKMETTDTTSFLDGEIESFLEGYLHYLKQQDN